MNWQNYKLEKRYKNTAVGLLDDEYVFERKILSGMASNFYKISEKGLKVMMNGVMMKKKNLRYVYGKFGWEVILVAGI